MALRPLTWALAVPEGLALQAASGTDDLEAANEVPKGSLECGNHDAATKAPKSFRASLLHSPATPTQHLYPVGDTPTRKTYHLHGRGGATKKTGFY